MLRRLAYYPCACFPLSTPCRGTRRAAFRVIFCNGCVRQLDILLTGVSSRVVRAPFLRWIDCGRASVSCSHLLLTVVCPRVCPQKKTEAQEYHKMLVTRLKEQRERRSESLAKKRAIRQASVASKEA